MPKIFTDHPLKDLNSFGLSVIAARFLAAESEEQLVDFFTNHYLNEPFILLGEGSNTLFTGNYEGLVIHPRLSGIQVISETQEELFVEVGAGESWDDFVAYAVDREWYGAENLSLIPGAVGSVPVQNIGAYGVEAADLIHQVKIFDIDRSRQRVIPGAECQFGYRTSIFKQVDNSNLIITRVVFRLHKTPQYNLDYGDVRSRFALFLTPSLKNLRQTIIDIRREKLPDPAVTGNAGSFFKNPVIGTGLFTGMQQQWPGIPGYTLPQGMVKVPAAWLIQECGWKGYREEDVGCWPNQPLVLVNYGKASGPQILALAEKIAESVQIKFGITLEREVRVI